MAVAAAAIVVCLSHPANAAIKTSCESWAGGSAIRCLADKTTGDSPESFHIGLSAKTGGGSNLVSIWWSVCGLPGLPKDLLADGLDYLKKGGVSGELKHAGECVEVFLLACHVNGLVPCTNYLNTDPAVK